MQEKLTSNRIELSPLSLSDAAFIFKLLNSPGWIKFIGNRNIENLVDAESYIQKITTALNVNYWTVKLYEKSIPIGVVTLIKREYLNHPDIGFAFLPEYTGKGLAFEAASLLIEILIQQNSYTQLLATTVKENQDSIRLLEKLGLQYSHEVIVEVEALFVYAASMDELAINQLTFKFYNCFNNKITKLPDLDILYQLCTSDCIIIKKAAEGQEIFTVSEFIAPRKKILTDGTLCDFEEGEIRFETTIKNNSAQRFSQYKKCGKLNGIDFQNTGSKIFDFRKTNYGWKICGLIWEDEKN